MNKPLTREEWLTYLDTTWKKCLADAWQKEWDDMTREEITRMAREAGFVGFDGDNGSLRRFAALVAAAEREACAQAARTAMLGADWVLTERVLKAIRKRGEKE
jgi:hypothetical protein